MNNSFLNSNELIEVLASQHFTLNSDDILIKKRKNGLQEKPPLYLFNLSKMVYVSSLKQVAENKFKFDVRKGKVISDIYFLTVNNGKIEVEKYSEKIA